MSQAFSLVSRLDFDFCRHVCSQHDPEKRVFDASTHSYLTLIRFDYYKVALKKLIVEARANRKAQLSFSSALGRQAYTSFHMSWHHLRATV